MRLSILCCLLLLCSGFVGCRYRDAYSPCCTPSCGTYSAPVQSYAPAYTAPSCGCASTTTTTPSYYAPSTVATPGATTTIGR